MATHTLNAQAERGSPAKGVEASPLLGARFFSINASYSIDADSSEREALHNDFRCLFASGLAVLHAEAERLNQAQHAALYLFRQASGILDALDLAEGDEQAHQQGAAAQTGGAAAGLRRSLQEADSSVKASSTGIIAICQAAKALMQTDEHAAAKVMDLLDLISDRAARVEADVSAEAESHGCSYIEHSGRHAVGGRGNV